MAPRPILERICCGAWVQSNAEVQAEVSRDLLLDVDYLPRPWLQLKASLFRNDFDHYIQKLAVFTYQAFHPSFQQVNYDDVRIEGGELSAEVRLHGFTGGFQATRVSARSEEPLAIFPWSSVPPSSPYYPFRHIHYELPAGRIFDQPRDQASVRVGWDDDRRGFHLGLEGQYTGSMLIQQQNETGVGAITETWETPSIWVYNFRFRTRLTRHFSLFGGVDNISDEFETRLDDPRYEYNWGPLRGRYYYGGLSYEM
jgi:outer membrane receptor protein involved in Fe transport